MKEEIKENPFSLDVVTVRLVKDADIFSDKPFNNPQAAINGLGKILSELDREVFCVINLQSDGVPINVNIASVGTINYSLVSPRELLKASILSNAANMIVVHNHPSGRVIPSNEDIKVTKRLSEICKMMDIPLLDHIIVGHDEDYFSFYEHQMIDVPGKSKWYDTIEKNDIDFDSESKKCR